MFVPDKIYFILYRLYNKLEDKEIVDASLRPNGYPYYTRSNNFVSRNEKYDQSVVWSVLIF